MSRAVRFRAQNLWNWGGESSKPAKIAFSSSAGSRGATIKSIKGPSIVFKDEAERPSELSRDD